MSTDALLESLGYASSANCLRGEGLKHAPDFAHLFRRAEQRAGLEAVYCLRPPDSASPGRGPTSVTPVSYVCKAASFDEADKIHRVVWNQNVVPFLIVLAPGGVRVYTGFDRPSQAAQSGGGCVIESDLNRVAIDLAALSAESIDSGGVWDRLGKYVRPEKRVEWRLLADLAQLAKKLIAAGLTDSAIIHALIGKFVYLYYLRHREILSDSRLAKWGLPWDQTAGRAAQLTAFARLCDELDEWLNGSVFPISQHALKKVGASLLRQVAAVFAGDEPGGQKHFSFDAYDFSCIPIETLSVIYEQFLHLKETKAGSTAGRERAAYYTPIPVVNFMIDRMDELRPLKVGMRVLDFACGSGAFLVQCYRKLVEDSWRAAPNKTRPRASELRELLVKHVFGIDVDGDACRVAELSLVLTLLDYIEPPDLLTRNGHERFRLPNLTGVNIVQANAFDQEHDFVTSAKSTRFDWIIGNPPWKDLKGGTSDPVDRPVLDWMLAHKAEKPTGGNQTAEAFAWRTQDFAGNDALAGLLMPAMTLFKSESKSFRHEFFASSPPAYVANFANLAEVLFAAKPKSLGKHSRVPAAALVFQPRRGAADDTVAGRIPVFSPLVANQEAIRPREPDQRVPAWNIVAHEGEIRPLDLNEIRTGDALVWKLAAWGSEIDRRLLRRLAHVPTLDDVGLSISEGLQLRGAPVRDGEAVEHHPELAGKLMLVTKRLAGLDRVFSFPGDATREVVPSETYVRQGRFTLPESVCRPPHVVVSAARNWAVFESRYLIVPPRQIGIAGKPGQAELLKALAVYLNSDFVRYQQFFSSTEHGVKRERATLTSLRNLPVPQRLVSGDAGLLGSWSSLYDELAVSPSSDRSRKPDAPLNSTQDEILRKLNRSVDASLGLRPEESGRVHDFVNVLLGLEDGKVESRAVRCPSGSELRAYADALKRQLDTFIGADAGAKHALQVWHDTQQGVVQLDLAAGDATVTVHPREQSVAVVRQVAALRQELEARFTQWRYFNRGLRIFAKDRLYLFKPMQRFHWLESQAMLDAGEVIGLVLDQKRGT